LTDNSAVFQDVDVEVRDGSRIIRRVRKVDVRFEGDRGRSSIDDGEVPHFQAYSTERAFAGVFIAFSFVVADRWTDAVSNTAREYVRQDHELGHERLTGTLPSAGMSRTVKLPIGVSTETLTAALISRTTGFPPNINA
jgi:hypothetical protein